MLLSLFFCAYLCHFRPFIEPEENRMQILNEVCYLCVSVLYFCFTDFNPDPEIKIHCGWVVILIVISNLIWPNLTFMLRGVSPDCIKICKKTRKIVRYKKSFKAQEKARQMFIKKYKDKIKLKEEYRPKVEKVDLFVPRRNQVVPK